MSNSYYNSNLHGKELNEYGEYLRNSDINMSLYNKNNIKKHDVIPTSYYAMPREIPSIRNPQFINKQIKLVIHSGNKKSGNNGNFIVKLQQPIKDVITARLLNCLLYDEGNNYDNSRSGGSGLVFSVPTDFLTLTISEFSKNQGIETKSPTLDRIEGSFAVLDYKGNTATTNILSYNNEYRNNYDIKYFDPPLNSLNELNIVLHDKEGYETGNAFIIKMELLIETIEKMRIY
jgi:hypothetical protein